MRWARRIGGGRLTTNRYKFQKRQRLSTQADFDRVFRRKCSAGDALLVVYVDANGLTNSRLGLRVGKRTGGAVTRFRIKRLIREAYRLSQHDLPPGFDILCIAKPTAKPSLDAYRNSLNQLAARARRRYHRLKTGATHSS